MIPQESTVLQDSILEHIEKLLHSSALPEFPAEVDKEDKLYAIHNYLVTLRTTLNAFATGDLQWPVDIHGVIAGRLKALQANLMHLTWQIQQVAAGDFTQRVDFMGEYAAAFNSMVTQLDNALTSLRQKEEELTKLTEALRVEIAEKEEALAILRKKEAQFKHLAEHDALTGVLNRRSFYELACAEFKRAEEKGYPCSLAIIDIDFFKQINDTCGHLQGDDVLRHITKTIKSSLRHGGIIGRYGGDEFVVLLPGLDLKTTKKIVDRLRKQVAQAPFKTSTGTIHMTVSIGLAYVMPQQGLCQDTIFFKSVIKTADNALYAAKEAGRNCLVTLSHCAQQDNVTGKE